MILSSNPAFKARGLKSGLRKTVHIIYCLKGGIDPLDPSRKYATDVEINVLFGHQLSSTNVFNKNTLRFADLVYACSYIISDYYFK